MTDELESAQKRIDELEKEVESQRIIIEALVRYSKDLLGACHDNLKKEECGGSNKRAKPEDQALSKKAVESDSGSRDESPLTNEALVNVQSARNEVHDLIERRKQDFPFRSGIPFDEFLVYCGAQGITLLAERSSVKIGSGTKAYIEANMAGLIRYIFRNINSVSLCETFPALLMVSTCASYAVKLTLAVNVILSVLNPCLITYLCYAAVGCEITGDGVLEETLRALLSFQMGTDVELMRDDSVISSALAQISRNMRIPQKREDLAQHALRIIDEMDFNVCDMGRSNLDEIYSIILVVTFLDWDWAYTFLLGEKIMAEDVTKMSPKSVFLAGLIGTVGLDLVGKHESVMSVFNEMNKLLKCDDFKLGAVAYFFIRRIDSRSAHMWRKKNIEKIKESVDVDAEYLIGDLNVAF